MKPLLDARLGPLDATIEIVPPDPQRYWGDIGRIVLHELARKLPEYHEPIDCPAEGKNAKTGAAIPVNEVGRWLFGVPGYKRNYRTSISPSSSGIAGNPKNHNSIFLHYPSRSPEAVHRLVRAIKEAIEKEEVQLAWEAGGEPANAAPVAIPVPGRVFISHSTADREFVEGEIISLLAKSGINVWYCKEDIRTAMQWERSIMEGLRACEWFLVVMSARAAQSEWVKDEVHWAIENRPGRLVPVLIGDCDPRDFHIRMARLQHVDFRSDLKTARQKLLSALGPSSA